MQISSRPITGRILWSVSLVPGQILPARKGTWKAASLAVIDMIERLRIEVTEIVIVPETFEVPPSQVAAVECEHMIVRADSIAFIAIPKHASIYVQTREITIPILEAAASEGPTSGTPSSVV